MWNMGWTGGAGFCHSRFPVSASKAETLPLIPNVNNRPSANVGVDFGPGPWRDVDGFNLNAAG